MIMERLRADAQEDQGRLVHLQLLQAEDLPADAEDQAQEGR